MRELLADAVDLAIAAALVEVGGLVVRDVGAEVAALLQKVGLADRRVLDRLVDDGRLVCAVRCVACSGDARVTWCVGITVWIVSSVPVSNGHMQRARTVVVVSLDDGLDDAARDQSRSTAGRADLCTWLRRVSCDLEGANALVNLLVDSLALVDDPALGAVVVRLVLVLRREGVEACRGQH